MQRYAKKSILRVLRRPSWISSKYYCYTCKKKWNPIFFLSRSYSEPESVAKSILTNKKSEITNGPALSTGLIEIPRKSSTVTDLLYTVLRFLRTGTRRPLPSPPFLHSLLLEVSPLLRLWSLGEHITSPRSPAAKCILVYFRHTFAPFNCLMTNNFLCYCPLK